MTVTLRHAIKISAPRHRVFTALSDTGEVAAWHVGGVDGETDGFRFGGGVGSQ